MVPLIVLSAIILNTDIKTSDLKNIIISSDEFSSNCYNLTLSFIKEQNSDERYKSLDSYLKSLEPVCIALIVFYSITIFFSAITGMFLKESQRLDITNLLIILYSNIPVRIILLISSITCITILRIRSYTDNCEVFMNYYELCSAYYGDNFKNNFSNIINVKTYTLCIIILFVWDIVYYAIISFCASFG